MGDYMNEDPTKWNKVERIRFLLDHWTDIFDGGVVSRGIDGSSKSVPRSREPGRLPEMASHPSVTELQRCLSSLAEGDPAGYKHLKAYRCCEWRTVDTIRSVKLVSGKWDIVPDRMRERIVPRWVSPGLVADAEKTLEALFRGEVFIPKDLWDGLTKPVAA